MSLLLPVRQCLPERARTGQRGAIGAAYREGVTSDDARVTLYGRPGCHLCDLARETIAAVCAEEGVGWVEWSVDDDPALRERYGEQVPVTLVDGRQHDYWRVDADRLRAALTRPPRRR